MPEGDPRGFDGGGDHDLVAMYLSEIGRYPLLTKDDEVDLWRTMHEGKAKLAADDEHVRKVTMLGHVGVRYSEGYREKIEDDIEDTKHKFINSNLRLVVSIAKKYQKSGMPLLDLIQEGNLGLNRAVEKFDARKGFKFSTYGTWWIKQAITRGIHKTNRTIRLPNQVEERLGNITKARERLYKLGIESPDIYEIAEESGLAPATVQAILDIENQFTETPSLDAPLGADGDAELKDVIGSKSFYDPQEKIEDMSDSMELARVLKKCLREGAITEKELRVLAWRFDLDHQGIPTLENVGEWTNLTRERIRQIESGTLAKVQAHLQLEIVPYKRGRGRQAS